MTIFLKQIALGTYRLGFVKGVAVYKNIQLTEAGHVFDACVTCGNAEGELQNKCVTCFAVIHRDVSCSKVAADNVGFECLKCCQKMETEALEKAKELAKELLKAQLAEAKQLEQKQKEEKQKEDMQKAAHLIEKRAKDKEARSIVDHLAQQIHQLKEIWEQK